MWVETKPDKEYNQITFAMNYKQWNQFKKKVDEEFENDYASYNEVRFSLEEEDILEFESHVCLDKRRRLNKR